MDIGFSDKARLEINVSKYGVTVLGNVEGYLALARFCTLMAETHSDIREEQLNFESGDYHLCEHIPAKAIKEARYIFSPGPIKAVQPQDCVQDVLFNVTERIGPSYWNGSVESGAAEDWIDYYLPFALSESEEDHDD